MARSATISTHIFLFLALHFAEQIVEGVRNLGFRAFGAHLVAEFRHKAAQFLELFGIGHVVNAIRQHLGLLAFGDNRDVFGHRTVGQEHEFFHQLVGIFRHLDVSRDGMSLIVDFEAHFCAIKADGSGFETPSTELFGEAVEEQNLGRPFAHRVAAEPSTAG